MSKTDIADGNVLNAQQGDNKDVSASSGSYPMTRTATSSSNGEIQHSGTSRDSTTSNASTNEDLIIDREGNTKLHIAAREGNLMEVQRLVASSGLHLTGINQDDWTPFHHAASRGRLEVMEWMLAQNPDLINAATAYGYTALMLVAKNGGIEVAQWLAKHGANCSAKDKSGKDFIDFLQESVPDMAQYLPEHNASQEDVIEALGVLLELSDVM